MKKVLLLSLLVAFTVGLSAQSQRTALLEHFTQASCAPCATNNPLVKQYFDNNPTNRTAIKYQTSWPGVDPMNAHNPTEIQDRVTYYGVTGVPDVVIDGNVAQGNPGTLFAGGQSAAMDGRVGVSSNFDITVFHSLSSDLSSLNVNGVVTATNAVANANLKLHVVVVEKHIAFASAPGSNGETDFYNVMKKMLPNSSGTTLQGVWANGNTHIISESWNFSNVYNIGDLGIVTFVQDDVTKEVLQASFADIISLPANVVSVDLGTTATAFASTDYCSTSYIPEATVSNSSNTNLDSVEVSYTVNGAPGGTQMLVINGGASATATFPSINVAFGDEVVFNSIIQDAGFIDLASINNQSIVDNFVVLDPNFDNGTDLDVTWDNGTLGAPSPPGAIDDNPADIRAYYVDNTISQAVTWNLGGNGNSNGCFRWDYYSTAAGESSSLIFEDIDLSSKTGTSLSFTYAYAQYIAEPDQLTILASNDCGATWTELFDKSGADLATVAPLGNARFYPNVNDWQDETVDMSMFDGESDVIIKVLGTSAYGNSLYLDDMKTSSVTSTENVELETSLNVYPNPTVDNFTIEFELANSEKLNINLVNAIGQTVRPIENRNFNGGKHLINVNASDLAAGTYFVTIRNQAGVTTKTITVTK